MAESLIEFLRSTFMLTIGMSVNKVNMVTKAIPTNMVLTAPIKPTMETNMEPSIISIMANIKLVTPLSTAAQLPQELMAPTATLTRSIMGRVLSIFRRISLLTRPDGTQPRVRELF